MTRKLLGYKSKTLCTRFSKAKREVIISAGAFQSPQLLIVSGIGPIETLQQHNIDPVVELPGVGQKMWDHPFFAPSYRVQVPTLTGLTDIIHLTKEFLRSSTLKTGCLTNPVSDYLAWERIPDILRSQFSSTSNSQVTGPRQR